MPDKPGATTSEFKLTMVVMAVGLALDTASIVLDSLVRNGVHSAWLPAVLAVCGTGLMLAKALGYTRSRTLVKLAALEAQSGEVLKVAVPFAKRLAEVVTSAPKDPTLLSPSPTPSEPPPEPSPPA